MASISEIQAMLAKAGELAGEASLAAVQASMKATEAKQLYTIISNEGATGLLNNCQVATSQMIEASATIVRQAGIAIENGQRLSNILSA